MAWSNPIYDRTYEDISYAKAKITEWIDLISKGEPVSIVDLKGCFNLVDINRIESNTEYLSNLLNTLEYVNSTNTHYPWIAFSVLAKEDIERILANINALIDCFYKQGIEVPASMRFFHEVNDVELILYKLNQMIELMINSFQKSGTFKSGSRRMLPIKRG